MAFADKIESLQADKTFSFRPLLRLEGYNHVVHESSNDLQEFD